MSTLPTEAIGSIPRPGWLMAAIQEEESGTRSAAELEDVYERATRVTIRELEATGSPVVSDGEQRKTHSFLTYALRGMTNTAPDGFAIPFVDGHVRRLPRLTSGPFRYAVRADTFVTQTRALTARPVKQSVISPSALSLLYPDVELADYSRDEFISDLLREHASEIRGCLDAGACAVQIDFTEARLAVKLDPTKALVASFVDLNNLALDTFTDIERRQLGVHTCPGADRDTTHSADVDYAELLPVLFQLEVTNFYVALSREPDAERVLHLIANLLRPHQRVFIGVTDPISPSIETPEEIRDRVVQAARIVPPEQLGTTDDCGFSPFSDDTSTSRSTAFAKIRARVEGTVMASEILNGN